MHLNFLNKIEWNPKVDKMGKLFEESSVPDPCQKDHFCSGNLLGSLITKKIPMKNFKNLFLVLLMISLGFSAAAQTLGVRAGFNLSNAEVKDDVSTYSDDYMYLPGFHAGVIAEFPVAGILSVEGGAFFSTRGYKAEDEMVLFDEKYEFKYKTTLYYLVIPVTAKATIDVGPLSVFGQIGGYAGSGLTGNYYSETTIAGVTDTEETDVEWGNDENNDHFKRLDFGLTAGAGVQVKNIRAGVAYEHGLANICTYTQNGYSCANRVISVYAAFIIGGN